MDKAIIRLKNLTKKFGDFTAVNSLSLEVGENEIFGILGPNGAGKTTTINMICGLSKPTEGTIKFNLKESPESGSYINQIGYCPQENVLWPKMTCREQLEFMSSMYGQDYITGKKIVSTLIGKMQLEEKKNTLAEELSGGMKKKLSIALSLVHNPKILILDEPESGLDPQGRIRIRQFIQSMTENKTVILTTHNMDEADRLSDRIAILHRGRLLKVDTPEQLKKSVGWGDILKIRFDEKDKKKITSILKKIKTISKHAKLIDSELAIQSTNVIEKISEISRVFESRNVKIIELKLAENTLEDVFIHLTKGKANENI